MDYSIIWMILKKIWLDELMITHWLDKGEGMGAAEFDDGEAELVLLWEPLLTIDIAKPIPKPIPEIISVPMPIPILISVFERKIAMVSVTNYSRIISPMSIFT